MKKQYKKLGEKWRDQNGPLFRAFERAWIRDRLRWLDPHYSIPYREMPEYKVYAKIPWGDVYAQAGSSSRIAWMKKDGAYRDWLAAQPAFRKKTSRSRGQALAQQIDAGRLSTCPYFWMVLRCLTTYRAQVWIDALIDSLRSLVTRGLRLVGKGVRNFMLGIVYLAVLGAVCFGAFHGSTWLVYLPEHRARWAEEERVEKERELRDQKWREEHAALAAERLRKKKEESAARAARVAAEAERKRLEFEQWKLDNPKEWARIQRLERERQLREQARLERKRLEGQRVASRYAYQRQMERIAREGQRLHYEQIVWTKQLEVGLLVLHLIKSYTVHALLFILLLHVRRELWTMLQQRIPILLYLFSLPFHGLVWLARLARIPKLARVIWWVVVQAWTMATVVYAVAAVSISAVSNFFVEIIGLVAVFIKIWWKNDMCPPVPWVNQTKVTHGKD